VGGLATESAASPSPLLAGRQRKLPARRYHLVLQLGELTRQGSHPCSVFTAASCALRFLLGLFSFFLLWHVQDFLIPFRKNNPISSSRRCESERPELLSQRIAGQSLSEGPDLPGNPLRTQIAFVPFHLSFSFPPFSKRGATSECVGGWVGVLYSSDTLHHFLQFFSCSS